jgi:DNA-binding MarR family transcriptional regulator
MSSGPTQGKDRARTAEQLAALDQALSVVVRHATRPSVWSEVAEAVARESDANLPQIDRSGYPLLGRIGRIGPVRPSELATQFGVKLSTISRQVSELERLGLVERAADPSDARASKLELSPTGRSLLAAARRVRHRRLEQFLADWSDEDRAELTRLLSRFAHTVAPSLCSEQPS